MSAEVPEAASAEEQKVSTGVMGPGSAGGSEPPLPGAGPGGRPARALRRGSRSPPRAPSAEWAVPMRLGRGG